MIAYPVIQIKNLTNLAIASVEIILGKREMENVFASILMKESMNTVYT